MLTIYRCRYIRKKTANSSRYKTQDSSLHPEFIIVKRQKSAFDGKELNLSDVEKIR